MAQIDFKSIRGLKKNESLAKHTTFGIGGPADWFCEAKTTEEVVEAVTAARKAEIPSFILGKGSNLLVADEGFRGLVIAIRNTQYVIRNTEIIAEAGAPLAELVEMAAKSGLSGLEFAVGIPGTIGGAIAGNAGTANKWIGDLVEKVEVLGEDGEIHQLPTSECQFGYRTSRFKKTKEVILRVWLRLKKDEPKMIKKKMAEFWAKRKNQPIQKSVGSVFKNPPGKSAGWFIDQCGLKGTRIGDAQISPKHANFIVNLGQASCQDVLKLISLAKEKVKQKFGVVLDEEIKIVGEF